MNSVLDTNVAELSAGRARNAPWANPDGVLTEAHLKAETGRELIAGIARFAVQHGSSELRRAPTCARH
jgi:hypothetical protein